MSALSEKRIAVKMNAVVVNEALPETIAEAILLLIQVYP